MSERAVEVLEPGIQTTVQDYPGRRGMLAQGFFPAGPMDDFAFRVSNLLVGNSNDAAGLEVTLGNVALRFLCDATVAVCGPEAAATLDEDPLPLWESARARAGSILRIGVPAAGFRFYVAAGGGINVPKIFGSRATYTMGSIGGLDGRALRKGDRLPIGSEQAPRGDPVSRRFPHSERPSYGRVWELAAMEGPQGAPDYLTSGDMEAFFAREWSVDTNSNRTGIRLEPHAFQWARPSGGIAGGHPSNILDNPYPVGGVNINGDLPVILGPDGPTAGGFVVAATVIEAARWKLGQLRPVGDRVRFQRVTLEEALALRRGLDARLSEDVLEDA